MLQSGRKYYPPLCSYQSINAYYIFGQGGSGQAILLWGAMVPDVCSFVRHATEPPRKPISGSWTSLWRRYDFSSWQ